VDSLTPSSSASTERSRRFDPQRLFLRPPEGLENAGAIRTTNGSIGVFAGMSNNTYSANIRDSATSSIWSAPCRR
jgi:acyl transferase domain-containing protein